MDWKMELLMKIYGENVVAWCINIFDDVLDDVLDVLGKNMKM